MLRNLLDPRRALPHSTNTPCKTCHTKQCGSSSQNSKSSIISPSISSPDIGVIHSSSSSSSPPSPPAPHALPISANLPTLGDVGDLVYTPSARSASGEEGGEGERVAVSALSMLFASPPRGAAKRELKLAPLRIPQGCEGGELQARLTAMHPRF
mmetsp:Transcript_943/g.2583  ORF Transcript_943/g.2583 Transcript_943/m.2583 type:complete len:154 (-) Transcript_943:173-634(-)